MSQPPISFPVIGQRRGYRESHAYLVRSDWERGRPRPGQKALQPAHTVRQVAVIDQLAAFQILGNIMQVNGLKVVHKESSLFADRRITPGKGGNCDRNNVPERRFIGRFLHKVRLDA